jgi:hypothetical protein
MPPKDGLDISASYGGSDVRNRIFMSIPNLADRVSIYSFWGVKGGS